MMIRKSKMDECATYGLMADPEKRSFINFPIMTCSSIHYQNASFFFILSQ